ncbi:MAG: dockerin type I repeat-containing protein, partial [Candidatus Zixiibacteriota bacterium]
PIPIIVYTPGDVNKSGTADVTDIVFITNYVLKSGPEPDPLIAGDVNADCTVDIVDAVYLVNYVFKSGPAPLPGCTSVDDC